MTDRPTERRRIGTTKAAFLIEFSVRKGSAFGVSLPPSLTLARMPLALLSGSVFQKNLLREDLARCASSVWRLRQSSITPCGVWAIELVHGAALALALDL